LNGTEPVFNLTLQIKKNKLPLVFNQEGIRLVPAMKKTLNRQGTPMPVFPEANGIEE